MAQRPGRPDLWLSYLDNLWQHHELRCLRHLRTSNEETERIMDFDVEARKRIDAALAVEGVRQLDRITGRQCGKQLCRTAGHAKLRRNAVGQDDVPEVPPLIGDAERDFNRHAMRDPRGTLTAGNAQPGLVRIAKYGGAHVDDKGDRQPEQRAVDGREAEYDQAKDQQDNRVQAIH